MLLSSRFSDNFKRLTRCEIGTKRNYAPMLPILLLDRSREKQLRLVRLARGDSRCLEPSGPI